MAVTLLYACAGGINSSCPIRHSTLRDSWGHWLRTLGGFCDSCAAYCTDGDRGVLCTIIWGSRKSLGQLVDCVNDCCALGSFVGIGTGVLVVVSRGCILIREVLGYRRAG